MTSKKTKKFTVSDSTTGEISFTFNYEGTTPSADEPELIMLGQLDATELYNGSMRARHPATGKEMVLPAQVYNALTWCDHFATLEDHIESLAEGSPDIATDRPAIRDILQSVLDGGLMLSAKQIARALQPASAPATEPEAAVIVVTTWERPQALERLLGSIQARVDASHVHACYVLDDSRSEKASTENQKIVAALSGAGNAKIEFNYFGATAMSALMAELISALPDQAPEIRFLLDRQRWTDLWTTGLARNYSQLLSAGHPLIIMDDDVICDVYDPPLDEQPTVFSSGQRDARFFSTDDDWKSLQSQSGRDPVARHLQCLGKSLPQALAIMGLDAVNQHQLSEIDAVFAASLNAESRVVATGCGSLGDPGTGSNLWLAELRGDSLQDLLKSEESVRLALSQRNSWSGRASPTFKPQSDICQVFGLDNTQLLPPYFPVFRGQDRIFGAMTRYLYPTSLYLDQAWSVPHQPLPQRGWSDAENDFSLQASFPRFQADYIANQGDECRAMKPSARLQDLAGVFSSLAEADTEFLLDIHADQYGYIKGNMEQLIKSHLSQSFDAPSSWQRHMKAALQQIKDFPAAPASLDQLSGRPRDLKGSALLEFWRSYWGDFAAAILAWPTIRDAAREIVARAL